MFFVESEEEFTLCPSCSSRLKYHCRVVRTLTDSTGTKNIYSVRVMKCDNKSCPTTYHRELPDIIVPYKRYDAESIEQVIDQRNSKITVAADESTIWRWRNWFKVNATHIMMALISVLAVIENDTESSSLEIKKQNSDNPIEVIKKIVSRKMKWLNETVRILVNSSKWGFTDKFNRSAFLSG